MSKKNNLKELGTFIRKKRESTKPETYQLSFGKRKTPGLRREEVSVLSGISISLYTLIEQGQYDHPSVDVLKAIARVLKMDNKELNHMLNLSENSHLTGTKPTGLVSDDIIKLLDNLKNTPAMVLDAYWNILYINPSLKIKLGLTELTSYHFISMLFDDELTKNFVNLDELKEYFTAVFRYKTSTLYHDKVFQEILSHLIDNSSGFEEIWAKHLVLGNPDDITIETEMKKARIMYRFLPLYPVTDSNLIIFTFIEV